jgi:mono/diheme cytochrome c family protein
MKYLSFRTALVALLACGLIAACASPALADDVGATYKSKCSMCHGPDGKGSAVGTKMGARDFAAPEVKAETDAQLTDVITKGKGKMPAYSAKLKDTEIKDLVTYIRGLAK